MKRKWILTRDKIFLVESTSFFYLSSKHFVYLSEENKTDIFFTGFFFFFKKKGNFSSIAVKIFLIQI